MTLQHPHGHSHSHSSWENVPENALLKLDADAFSFFPVFLCLDGRKLQPHDTPALIPPLVPPCGGSRLHLLVVTSSRYSGFLPQANTWTLGWLETLNCPVHMCVCVWNGNYQYSNRNWFHVQSGSRSGYTGYIFNCSLIEVVFKITVLICIIAQIGWVVSRGNFMKMTWVLLLWASFNDCVHV